MELERQQNVLVICHQVSGLSYGDKARLMRGCVIRLSCAVCELLLGHLI